MEENCIEFLRGLAANYRDQVTEIVLDQIQKMLLDVHENCKEKVAAMYLLASLGARVVAADGAQLVDVPHFSGM